MNVKEKDLVHKALTLAESVGSKVDGLQEKVDSGYWKGELNLGGPLPAKQYWQGAYGTEDAAVVVGTGRYNAGISQACYLDRDGWKLVTIPGGTWYAVCCGNGRWVAVGANKAAYSDNGQNWQSATLPSNMTLKFVCYGNGKFVAIEDSSSGDLVYSTDGITWQIGNKPSVNVMRSLTFSNGLFHILVDDGVYRSSDLSSWTGTVWINGYPNNMSLIYMASGGGVIVACSGSGSSQPAIIWSVDGVNYSYKLPGYFFRGAYYMGNGNFYLDHNGSEGIFFHAKSATECDITKGYFPTTISMSDGYLIVNALGVAVAIGKSDSGDSSGRNNVYYSYNGLGWTDTLTRSMEDSGGNIKTGEVLDYLNAVDGGALDAAYTEGVNAYQGE